MLNPTVLEYITRDYQEDEIEVVITELSSVELRHVMAESEYNLRNTHLSILKLAGGDIEEVRFFVDRAKIDFRDVIMWATERRPRTEK